VRLAAVVSLALAAAKMRDHVNDRDGVVGEDYRDGCVCCCDGGDCCCHCEDCCCDCS
jgi:hypothetical protein